MDDWRAEPVSLGWRVLKTARLTLQPLQGRHRAAFAEMHGDAVVMADLGGPIGREESDEKFERYRVAFKEHGVSRWAIEDNAGRFLGYAGVMPRLRNDHPLGRHHEVGWRLVRRAWGHGYAGESAIAALNNAFEVLGADEILSYTHDTNHRSRAVMDRLGLRREPSRDFIAEYDRVGSWRGLVWVATAGWRAP